MDDLSMKVAESRQGNLPGMRGQESYSTETEYRVCRTGLDVLMRQTVFYQNGRSRSTIITLCVPREQCLELARLAQEAATFELPRKLA